MTVAIIDARERQFIVLAQGVDLIAPLLTAAEGAADRAEAAQAVASSAAATASLAEASALVAGKLYGDVAEGLAGSSEGDFFTVSSGDEDVAILYRNIGGVAIEQNRFPGKLAIDKKLERVETLAALRAADIGKTIHYAGANYNFEVVDAPYAANDGTIESDHQPLTVGAWVRQGAATLSARLAAPGGVILTQEQVNAEEISVKRFGAKGNYLLPNGDVNPAPHNDTAAILAALWFIRITGRGTLYFPPGDYMHDPIIFDVNNIEVYGAGRTATRLWCTSPKNATLAAWWLRGNRIRVRDFTQAHTIQIDNTTAEDNNNRGPNAYGWRIGGRRDPENGYPGNYIAEDVSIERVDVRDARNGGISIYKTKRAAVRDCSVLRTLGNGIGFDGCTEMAIATGNTVEDTGDDMLICVTDATVPGGTKCVIFTSNIVKGGYAKGIASTGAERLVILGNTIEDTWAQGIGIIQDSFFNLGPSNEVICSNNVIKDAGRHYGPGQFKTAPGEVPYSIHVSSGTRNVTLADNICMGGVSHGIVVTASRNFACHGNKILNHVGLAAMIGNTDLTTYESIVNAIVHSNLAENCGNGFAIGNGSGVQVHHNTIRNCGKRSQPPPEGLSAETRLLYVGYLANSVVRDNILINPETDIPAGNYKATYGFLVRPGSVNPGSTLLDRRIELRGSAPPTAGAWAVGDSIVNQGIQRSSPVNRWECIVAGTPGTWRAASSTAFSGTTAQRPALTTSDVGVRYLDTTLAAAGKPIWWTGAAWVDALGAAA